MSKNIKSDDHWLTRPATIRKLWIVFIALLVITVIADFFAKHYVYFGIEATIGFSAWYGFLAAGGVFLVTRFLATVLKRPDNYYDH